MKEQVSHLALSARFFFFFSSNVRSGNRFANLGRSSEADTNDSWGSADILCDYVYRLVWR
jgi:hypothetical protein